MNGGIKTYLQQIERNLFTCPKKKRDAFLRDFRGSLNAYIEEHPEASVQELQGVFGSPEEIAEAFLRSEQFSTSKTVFSSKKRISRIVLISVCSLIAAALIFATIYIVDVHGYAHGYWEDSSPQSGILEPDSEAINSY